MNEAPIKVGSIWAYIGPGDGKNIPHTVTSVGKGEITTWSKPTPNPVETGWSWLGSINDFRRHFRPLTLNA